MANGAFKFKDNSGNVVSFISGSGSNISFSGGTLDLSGMTGLTLGNLTLSGTTQNALSASHAASYLLTSSFNTYSGTTDTVIGTLQTSTSSLNSFTSSATTRLNSIEGVSGSYATTGSNLFKGNQTISGSIIPAVDNAYDLGSSTHQFRDLYLSSASLYIDGTKVLGSTAQELQITTDTGQSFKILEAGSDNITLQSADGNIELKTSGGGDVIMDPTTGVIALKGTTTLYAGNKLLSSDGNAIQVGNSLTVTGSMIVTGYIETQELRTTYISSSILYRSGSTKFGDELDDTHSFTGSLLVSGTISVPGSGLISGSSQVLNGSGVFSGSAQLPSGIVSSSAQTIANLPSGTVSGSVQVDVMSTTNIARLATTGSNTFTSNQIVSGSITTTSNVGVGGSPSGTYGTLSVFGGISIKDNNNAKLEIGRYSSGVSNSYIKLGTNSNSLRFTNAGDLADIMELTNSGNLGLGVTPSSWASDWTVFQIGSMSSLGQYNTNNSVLLSNNYYNATTSGAGPRYIANGSAGVYQISSGVHYWYNAVSGTANAAMTLTTAMTLDSSGRLGVGYDTPAYQLQVLNTIGLRANSQNIQAIKGTGWGYSPSTYKVVMLGDTANNVTVSIGYDPSGNSNSAFNGGGGEVLFRNGASFATPTSANTAFHLNTLVLKDGNIGIGIAPTSWGSGATALQIGTAGSVWNRASDNLFVLCSNSYFNGSADIQITTGASNRIYFNAGQINFERAASTAAGAGTPWVTSAIITNNGYVYLGKGWGAANHRINLEVAQGNNILVVSAYAGASNDSVIIRAASGANPNATTSVMDVTTNSSTGRSISAGGTINASGNDYAEYMLKGVTDNISKGDIVGIDNEGLLTNIFSDSVSFVVKSTNPSYVGGDAWGNIVGKRPSRTTDQTEEDFAPILAEFETRLEIERQKVDRIAFSGQVPVNVTGATVGDYIIPIETGDGKITGQAITNPSFEQYKISVGKVWKIMEDGRAFIAVKIG